MANRADPAASINPTRMRVRMCMRSALRAELGLDDHESRPELKIEDVWWVARMGLVPLLSSQPEAFETSAEVNSAFGKGIRRNVIESLKQANATWFLQQRFVEAGIRVLAYKGTALSLRTTQSFTGRAPGDVDLLVHLCDAGQAHSLLASLGWSPYPVKMPPVGQRGWWATQRLTCETTYRGRMPVVDLHWRLDPTQRNYNASFDELWERRQSVSGGGVELITLGETDSLLLTAVHGTRERWMLWRHVVDAARQLEGWSGSEEELARRAADVGAKKSLALTIGMAGLAVGHSPGVRTRQYERLMARAWSHEAVGGTHGQKDSARGIREGQRWRWQTADTPSAAIVSFISPALRRVLEVVS